MWWIIREAERSRVRVRVRETELSEASEDFPVLKSFDRIVSSFSEGNGLIIVFPESSKMPVEIRFHSCLTFF